jgi:hypothetical protein
MSKMKRTIDFSEASTERFSPMREQRDKNVVMEWRELQLWNLNPDIAFAIADVIQECQKK